MSPAGVGSLAGRVAAGWYLTAAGGGHLRSLADLIVCGSDSGQEVVPTPGWPPVTAGWRWAWPARVEEHNLSPPPEAVGLTP